MKNSALIFVAVMFMISLVACAGQPVAKESCFQTVSTSKEAPNHPHKWCKGQDMTEQFCNKEGKCHKHKINLGNNLAEAAGAGPHTHQLK